jgi:uncharacterized repeat protein (TIGR02543 family)
LAFGGETVVDRQGGWRLVQADEGSAKALYLETIGDGARTQLAAVETPSATVTNVYWDEYAGWDEASGKAVGAEVERVDTVAGEYEFRAFVNGGQAYWEDEEGGTARLWTAPCKVPGAKKLLAQTAAAGAGSAFGARPWRSGASWREDGKTVTSENGIVQRAKASAKRGTAREADGDWVEVEFDGNGGVYEYWTTKNPDTGAYVPHGMWVRQTKRTEEYQLGRPYWGDDEEYKCYFPTFTKKGEGLEGWFTSASGGARVLESETFTKTSARTLFAHWLKPGNMALATALDNDALSFTSGGGAKWFGQTAESHDGVDSARSGVIGNKKTTWLETSLTGPATVTFLWKASCEEPWKQYKEWDEETWEPIGEPTLRYYDYAMFAVDGKEKLRVAGQTEWKAETFELGSGSHKLRWTYRKDSSGVAGLDCAWVDQVSWEADVAFNGNGGTPETQSRHYAAGEAYGELPEATRSGYAFAGWWTKKSGGTRVTEATPVKATAGRTLWAHWTKTQTLAYDANGGKCKKKSKKVTVGKKYGALAAATMAGHGHVGWADAPEGGKSVTAEDTVTAVAERKVYAQWTTDQQVKFDANGGEAFWSGHLADGSPVLSWNFDDGSLGEWTTLDRDGDGYNWVPASEVMEDEIYHNGSADCMLSQSYDGDYGVLTPDNWLVSPAVALGGRFSLWACAQDADWPEEHFGIYVSTNGNTDAGSFTLLGEWTFSEAGGRRDQSRWARYSVDLSAYAGQTGHVAIRHFNCSDQFYLLIDDIELTPGPEGTYAIGQPYAFLPTAAKAGAAFAGWYTAKKKGTKVTEASKATEEAARTLYAHWTTAQVLTYDANGGKCKTKSKKCTIGKKYGALATATKAGHGFTGWEDAAEGGDAVTAADLVTEEAARTVWAQWTTEQTVTFDANGGRCSPTSSRYSIGDAYGNLPEPTKAGVAFAGWYTAKKGGKKVTETSKVTEAATRTLYARWTTTQTVTFNANGGKCSTKTKKYTVGKTYGTLPTPTKKGGVFSGWYTKETRGERVAKGDPVPELAARTLYAHWDGGPKAPAWDDIPEQRASVGQSFSIDLGFYLSGNPTPTVTLVDGEASLKGTVLSFTPSAAATYTFTASAGNDLGSDVRVTFTVVAIEHQPTKYAVCVGINEYEDISSLKGCVNDSIFMESNLVWRGGWPAENVVRLNDGNATKDAIRTAISNVAAQAQAGDTFIYQQSSHGGQFHATDDDDGPLTGENGKAVYLCVYDEDYYDNTTAYNDYEIAADLAAFPSGVKVAVIVDACHSGGLFKGKAAGKAAAASFDLAGRVSAIMDANRATRKARGEDVARRLSSSEIGWATAAEYYEYSLDGGFYHTDEWMSDATYGEEYWDDYDYEYHYPDSYKMGGVFLTAATWGWWNGTGDTDAEAGDNDGMTDIHEFWKKGYDFCSTVGEFWYGTPAENFYPQCANIAVLKSIELGWVNGPRAPSSANPPAGRENASSLNPRGAIRGIAFASTRSRGADAAKGTCVLSLDAEAGTEYEILWTEDLTGEWTCVRRWMADKAGECEVEVTVPSAAGTGFFRLVETGDGPLP